MTEMPEYECRACHRYMFSSDAPFGRARIICPYRDCRVAQMVYFGGQQTLHERVDALERHLQRLRNGHGLRSSIRVR